MHEHDGTVRLVGAQRGDGHAVVAAQHQRQRAGRQHGAHRGLGVAVVGGGVGEVRGGVAQVHAAGVVTGEQGAADVEVEVLGSVADLVRLRPDRVRRQALVVGRLLRAVGDAVGDAEHGDIGLETVQLVGEGPVEEGARARLRGNESGLGHRFTGRGHAPAV